VHDPITLSPFQSHKLLETTHSGNITMQFCSFVFRYTQHLETKCNR